MNVYCINLASSKARKLRIIAQAQSASINVIFVPAVDGKEIDPANTSGYNRNKRLRYLKDMERNEIACTLSHIRALQAFIGDPFPFGIVLEDDATFDASFADDVSDLLQRVQGFDLLKLESRDARGPTIGDLDGTKIFLPLKASNGATAILYSKQGAEKLLHTLKHFHHPFDTHMGFAAGIDLVVAACWPPLVTEDKSQPSTISGRAESKRIPGIGAWLKAREERVRHSCMKRVYCFFEKKQLRLIDPIAPARKITSPVN